jgi:hypothetical protein
MKRLPITAKAKMGNTKSPLKFDYRFTKGVADQVAASKEFIAAGDAIGLGIDSAERRISRQQAQAQGVREEKAASGGGGPDMREFDKASSKISGGQSYEEKTSASIEKVKEAQKKEKYGDTPLSQFLSNQKTGGYQTSLTGGKKLAMGAGGVKVI